MSKAGKKYTIAQFSELEHVTDEALAAERRLVTMDGDMTWYRVVETSRRKVMLYEEKEPGGFLLMKHVEMRFINYNHRLAAIDIFERTLAAMDLAVESYVADLGRIRLNED